MAIGNMIPTMNSQGRFEALPPFDTVVDVAKTYTVEGLDSIKKLEVEKDDLYTLMFQPVGVSIDDYPLLLRRAREANAVVVTLHDRYNVPTYVFSTYFKSIPLIDGVIYEQMVMVASLGPCHPKMKEEIQQVLAHTRQYILNHLGIDATVSLGTIPEVGYTSQEQSDAYENTRKLKITDTSNDISRLNEALLETQKWQDYAKRLEGMLPPPKP